MKKLSAVLLAVLMALTCLVPMASAADATAIDYDALTDEEVIGIVLDWVDTKIKEAAPDFDQFEAYAQFAGVEIPEMEGINTLVAYKDHIAELGGDFANLNTSAIVDRTGGDIAFVNGLTQFMADNAAIFGKVFTWAPGTPFDYGKVGEYIMGLEDDNEIKEFYVKYLKDGYDIQKTFTEEIAREMGYTIPAGETFDDTLNNGIKAAFAPLLKELLKTQESKDAYDAFNLKTTDVYALVKAYIGLLQDDYKADIDTMASGIFNALIPALKDVKNAVEDIDFPVLEIGYTGNNPYATYTPSNPNVEAYAPNIYVNDQAKATMEQAFAENEQIDVLMNSEMSEADKALVATTGTAWGTDVIVNAAAGNQKILDNLTINLKTVEDAAIVALEKAVNGKSGGFTVPEGTPMVGGQSIAFNISDAKATFDYTMFKDEDSFAAQVAVKSATATVNITSPITATANVDLLNPDSTTIDWGSAATLVNLAKNIGFDADQMVKDTLKNAVGTMFADPAFATVVVNNLSGSTGIDLDSIKEMLSYIKDEPKYDDNLFDFFVNNRYDTYKGAVSQANRIVVDAAKMVLTDAGLKYFGISESNNIDTNIANIRTKANDLIAGAKDAINTLKNSEYSAYIPEGLDVENFDFGMLDDIDLSSNEALYVSMIKLAGDYIPAEMEEVKAILDTVKGYDTLDDMFVALINKCAKDLTAKEDVAELLAKIGYTYTNIPTGGDARANIIKEAAKAIFAGAEWAVGVANEKATELVKKIDDTMEVKFELGVAYDANDAEGSLNKLVDRFIDLTDGLFIAKFDKSKDVVSKAADILFAVLPAESMFSNVKSGADLAKIDGYIFNDALNGNFANLLTLAEVKDDAIAGNTPVTKALINASERIVKAFFPTTVSASSYEASETVQEYFTSYANDPAIAARNMVDINNRKADLIPFACNLLKESGLLPAFANAHTSHAWNNGTVTKAATCTVEGEKTFKCKVCGETKVEKIAVDPNNHVNTEIRGKKDATTEAEGYTGDTYCKDCGTKIATGSSIAKLPSGDSGNNGGNGGSGENFFQRIINSIRGFFDRIMSWFRSIFSR